VPFHGATVARDAMIDRLVTTGRVMMRLFGKFFVRYTASRAAWSLARSIYRRDQATKAAHALDEVDRVGATLEPHDRAMLEHAARGGLADAIARAHAAVAAQQTATRSLAS
jgi:hypothetical protein